jgi:ABC-2 type transport system permease protein
VGKGRIVRQAAEKASSKVCFLTIGTRLAPAVEAARRLEASDPSVGVTVADARWMKPLDTELIDKLAKEHDVLITVEENAIGGFGDHVLHYLALSGALDQGTVKVRPMVLPDKYIEAANQSKTFARAWGDLIDGFGKRELWLHLGWQDIKQKYRRSVLGPFWITIATGTTALAMGLLYSKLFNLEVSEHLPYVTVGLIIWNMINAAILEGSEVFIANEGLIKQLPTPLSVHVYRLVWRQMILFAHNIVIFVIIAIIYPKPWSWADLSVLPALLLIMLNCVWVAFCFGILATRYRDIGPLVTSLVQLLFFVTPIIWNADILERQGAGNWWRIIELNPLLHYLDILRAPLLGAPQEPRHWFVVIGLTIAGWCAAALALRQYRARVPYWV